MGAVVGLRYNPGIAFKDLTESDAVTAKATPAHPAKASPVPDAAENLAGPVVSGRVNPSAFQKRPAEPSPSSSAPAPTDSRPKDDPFARPQATQEADG
jgi:hypothetical protein